MRALRIVSKCKQLGLNITAMDVFSLGTIQKIAENASLSLPPSKPRETISFSEFALSPMQEGMLYHSVKYPNLSLYVQKHSWKITGHLDIEVIL